VAKADRDEWARRIQRWQDGGLTAREFASEMGLKATTLTYWKWRLKTDQDSSEGTAVVRSKLVRRKSTRSMQFVELKSVATQNTAPDARLELVIGACTVRIPNAFDDVTLRRLLAVVREYA
jgi:hypothetical protein